MRLRDTISQNVLKCQMASDAYLSANDGFDGRKIPVRSRSYVDSEGHIKWPPEGTHADHLGKPITSPAIAYGSDY